MIIIKIEENDANQRLDKFLKKFFPNANLSLIYKFNRKNKIKISSISNETEFRKKDIDYKLQEYDQIKFFISDKDFVNLREKIIENNEGLSNNKFNSKNIVYEDNDLLVINKDSWINVHAWDHKTKETNIIMQIQNYLWDKYNSLTFKPSLIHRIDRDTSWILLIAKSKNLLTKLVLDFKNHSKIKKTYHALVLWKLSRKNWTIKKKLKRIINAKNENKVQVSENGLTAISHYKLLKEYELKTKQETIIVSEIEVVIETWRMHQIRVHMSSIGHPIVWDKNYWNKKLNAFFANNYWLKRQALHAWKIEFFHYSKNKIMNLEAWIKDDIKNFIKKLN